MTTELTRKLVVFACFLVTAVTLIPIVMMVLVAFQSDAESMAATPSLWPTSWHPENLARVHPDHPAAGRTGHRDARSVQVHQPVEQPALAAGHLQHRRHPHHPRRPAGVPGHPRHAVEPAADGRDDHHRPADRHLLPDA